MDPEEGEENVISVVELGDYTVTAYSVPPSALSEENTTGYEVIPVSSKSAAVIVSTSHIERLVEERPSPFHAAYELGVFIGQTLTMEVVRLSSREENE